MDRKRRECEFAYIFSCVYWVCLILFFCDFPSFLLWCFSILLSLWFTVWVSVFRCMCILMSLLKGTHSIIFNNVELCGRKIRPIFKCGLKLCSSSENKLANNIQSEQKKKQKYCERIQHSESQSKHLKKTPLKVDERQIYGRIDWNLG